MPLAKKYHSGKFIAGNDMRCRDNISRLCIVLGDKLRSRFLHFIYCCDYFDHAFAQTIDFLCACKLVGNTCKQQTKTGWQPR
jgi:hypothetical protein